MVLPAFCDTSSLETTSHYMQGLHAFDEKNYELASVEFKASIDNEKAGTPGKFYYAACLYYLGRYQEAKEIFLSIYNSDRFSEWGSSASTFIESIDLGIPAPEQEKDLMAYINVAYDSEDNISYNALHAVSGADTRTSYQLYGAYKPRVSDRSHAGFSLNAYSAQYGKNTKYNMSGTSGDISMNTKLVEGAYFSLTWGTGAYDMNSSSYCKVNYMDSRVMFSQNNGASWTTIYLNGSNNSYGTVSYEGLDGPVSTVGIRQDLNPLMYVLYEKKASITRISDYSNRSDEIEVGATSPAPFSCKLSVSARLINKLYLDDDPLSPTGDVRHDTSNTFNLLLSRELISNLILGVKYTSLISNSNLDKLESTLGYGSYSDHVISLSLSYKI
jgi:hypothetical protein